MLRLDHVVRNCKDESVNFTGNIDEELKKLQAIISEFLMVPSLIKLGLQKIRNFSKMI